MAAAGGRGTAPDQGARSSARAGRRGACLIAVMALFEVNLARADSIRGSKHDLSNTSNPDSSQVCLYCHTPHHANNTLSGIQAPLWNRYVDTTKVYLVFSSPTMNTSPGSPSTTVSAVCLGCHDGSISSATVYGVVGSDKHDLINRPDLNEGAASEQCNKCHVIHGFGLPATLKLGTNLGNMHPIAMTYPTVAQDPAFNQPPDLQKGWSDLKLFVGKVECPTCHAVHDPAIKPFLRKSNDGSALCLTCHIK